MKHMRVVAARRGGPEVLEVIEEDVPEPAAGQARIKVLRAGVAFGDLLWQSGKVPGSPKPPFTPGYDLVGIVEELGAGVSELEVGQTVAALIQYGGYSEYVCVDAHQLVPVAESLNPSEVVCLTLNYITGYQIFRRLTEMRPGMRVLIHGAGGGAGTAMLQLGKQMGLETYGTASKSKHDLVTEIGATPIDYRSEDFVERILSLTGDGVDLVVDHIGGAHLKRSFRTLRPGGHLISTSAYGSVKGDGNTLGVILGFLRIFLWNMLPNNRSAQFLDIPPFNQKNPTYYREDMKKLLSYLAEGKIAPSIAGEFPLSEAGKAQEMVFSAAAKGKVVLICGER